MSLSLIDTEESFELFDRLSKLININGELPDNIFKEEGFTFWFFERELIDFTDILSGLISASRLAFQLDVLVKFSGHNTNSGNLFSLDGVDTASDVLNLQKEFRDFFGGTADYPIFFFNKSFDWLAIESAYEEFGVLALKTNCDSDDFVAFLNSYFISAEHLTQLSAGNLAESISAEALRASYLSEFKTPKKEILDAT